jgi:endonuclease YncB( thermonuclease family)
MSNRALVAVWLVGILTFCFGTLVGWTIKPVPHLVIPESPVVSIRDFRVEKVIDGNSFQIFYDGEPTVACIKGLEAPPMDLPEGQAAADELARIIAGRTVHLMFPQQGGHKRDSQGRLIVTVRLGEEQVVDVAEQLARRHAAAAGAAPGLSGTSGIPGTPGTPGPTE